MGNRGRQARTIALVMALALLAAGCSGSLPNRDKLATEDRSQSGDSAAALDDPTAAPGTPVEAGAPQPGAPGAPAPGTAAPPGPQGGAAATTQVATTGAGTSTVGGSGGTAQPIRDADLYAGADNTIGITPNEIRMCAHAALTFAQAFDTRPEDLNVYWEQVNAAGGIFGRKVQVTYEDDAYKPDQAVTAAETCKSKNIFLLLGGIGFDQIPAVRAWAEANKMLYFHHMAVEAGLAGKRYSFTGLPSVENIGRAFGEHILAKYKDKKIGILWRRSENWEPGYRAGKAFLERAGIQVVADLPVTQNQAVYNQEIVALRDRGAEVVWVWENALGAGEVIFQAQNQDYHPHKWVVFPFQTTLDVVGPEPIDGVAAWSAYTQGGFKEFADQGYGAEIARFEAAYAKHRPGVKTNDILWQVWVANKSLHDMFERCGPQCTRNRMAGIFLSGFKATVPPNCPVDFTRPDSFGGHLGGHAFFTMESTTRNGASFRTTSWCREHLN
ncbi:MAG TPA: ABC transporter substrate-binding protein [Acidimicrobiales bacterium]|nr:ABC transporter substrate-binding protein [Acidimicrobiales bacterium]